MQCPTCFHTFPKIETLQIVRFSDDYFASNEDLISSLGYILFLCDKEGNAAPVHFHFYKYRGVTSSVMSAEVVVFTDIFDCSYSLGLELSELLGENTFHPSH